MKTYIQSHIVDKVEDLAIKLSFPNTHKIFEFLRKFKEIESKFLLANPYDHNLGKEYCDIIIELVKFHEMLTFQYKHPYENIISKIQKQVTRIEKRIEKDFSDQDKLTIYGLKSLSYLEGRVSAFESSINKIIEGINEIQI